MDVTSRLRARQIANRHLAAGDPLGWFDEVYAEAERDLSAIPWADAEPNPHLTDWLDGGQTLVNGKRAMVVGCGLGDDAEELSRRGFAVTAFDVLPASIEWCQNRFPGSEVVYRVADLFQPPAEWRNGFDLIFEAYTLQSLPADLRPLAIGEVAGFLAPGGVLVVVALGRDPQDPDGGPPWPLIRSELETFCDHGLVNLSFDDMLEKDKPAARRFRAVYRNPGVEDVKSATSPGISKEDCLSL